VALVCFLGAYVWHVLMLREQWGYCSWLPEQQHVQLLFLGLLLWQVGYCR
jgi:hypothetical protein